jgi:hypothetical protein
VFESQNKINKSLESLTITKGLTWVLNEVSSFVFNEVNTKNIYA